MTPRRFSIGHRGAPRVFPEHTRESYLAAARTGAGVIECDVTFTRDLELVCRHAQDDLAQTTDILETPLAARCSGAGRDPRSARCLTSDLTLAEFRTLRGRATGAAARPDAAAGFVDEDLARVLPDAASRTGTLMTHAESIALFASLGVRFTPELKTPVVEMPFDGLDRRGYARRLVDEYRAAGVPPGRVYPQSFDLDDVRYWVEHEPAFGRQAVFLDGRYRDEGFDPARPESLEPGMAALKAMGVNLIAPPMWALVTVEQGRIVPSAYALAARAAGLEIVTWTLERSGSLAGGGGWYYQSIREVTDSDGVVYELLHALASRVGIRGIFSDWPATATYYANCTGLP